MLFAEIGDQRIARQVVLGPEGAIHVDVDALVVDHASRDVIGGEIGVIAARLQVNIGRGVITRNLQLRVNVQTAAFPAVTGLARQFPGFC